MDIDKIINIIREQRIDVSKLTAPTGGGGGTNALTSQAKVRTWGASLKSLIGGDYAAAKKEYNDPQRYLSDDEYKNRPTFAQYRRAEADKVLAKKKPLPHHKAYKNAFGESMGAGAVSGPTNNVGDGKIAGTVEAGDDPPVRKKKKHIYLGRGSRRNWMK
jgi:hypothetical protein